MIIIQYYNHLFYCFPALAIGSSFKMVLCTCNMGNIFKYSLVFWHQVHLHFPVYGPNINYFTNKPKLFYWRMVLETKIWEVDVLLATMMSLLLGPLGRKSSEIHECTQMYIHTYITFCIYLSIHPSIHLSLKNYKFILILWVPNIIGFLLTFLFVYNFFLHYWETWFLSPTTYLLICSVL